MLAYFANRLPRTSPLNVRGEVCLAPEPQMYLIRLILRCAVVSSLLCSFELKAKCEPWPSVAALRENVIQAKNHDEAYTAFALLFQRLSPAEIRELTKDENISIGLQAAWEIHKKPVKRPKPVAGREEEVFDPEELVKFLHFLKLRTKAPVPDWWAKLIVDVDLYSGRHHKFPAIEPTKGDIGPKLRKSKAGHIVTDGTELERKGDNLVFTIGSKSAELSSESVHTYDRLAGVVKDEKIVIACYPDRGVGYTLTALDSRTGKPTWNSAVWALISDFPLSGPEGFHRVELLPQERLLYVFGADLGGLYLEAFETSTGKCQFRFSTAFWGNHSRKWGDK